MLRTFSIEAKLHQLILFENICRLSTQQLNRTKCAQSKNIYEGKTNVVCIVCHFSSSEVFSTVDDDCVGCRENTAIPNLPSWPFNPLPSCISIQFKLTLKFLRPPPHQSIKSAEQLRRQFAFSSLIFLLMQLCLYAEADVPGQQRDAGQGGDDRHLPQAYQVSSYSFF